VSGQYLHLFLLGVAEQFTRRGIGQHLVAACLRSGAAKGCPSAVTEATNPVSQHIFGELGFKRQAERSYGEYRFGESAVFASISEHGGPIQMRQNRFARFGRSQHLCTSSPGRRGSPSRFLVLLRRHCSGGERCAVIGAFSCDQTTVSGNNPAIW
jgi:hypothetical protein